MLGGLAAKMDECLLFPIRRVAGDPPARWRCPMAETDNEFTQWHTVAKGETLGKIAERYYGDLLPLHGRSSRQTGS